MIVVIEKNANGKIEFTQEELETLLEKARQEGINEGTKRSYIYSPLTTPSTTPTFDPWPYQFTCQTGTVATSDTAKQTVSLNGTGTTNGI